MSNATASAVLMILSLSGLCACATTSIAHWEKPGGNESVFQADNETCGAVASRVGSSCGAGSGSCGSSIPPNHMDRPPHVDTNAVWQRAYMGCMADRGWRVAQE